MKKTRAIIEMLIVLFTLAACSAKSSDPVAPTMPPQETMTPVPTNTPETTATPTPEPKATPTKSPVHEHAWTVQETSSNCTTDGLIVEVCECGEQQNSTEVPATGHSAVKNITKEATVEEEGTWEEVCTVCGEVVNAGILERVETTPTPEPTATPTPKPTATPTPKPTATQILEEDIPPAYSDLPPVEDYDVSSKVEIARETGRIYLIEYNGVEYSNEIKQWKCGDNATLTVYTDGTLVVSGTGRMWDSAAYAPFDGCVWRIDKAYLSKNVKRIVIEEGITYVGKLAFVECYSVEYIDIASSVKEIGSAAFLLGGNYWDRNIKGIRLREGLEVIGYQAFKNCVSPSLSVVTIPSTVTTIGEYAFNFQFKNFEDYGFQSITIPESVTNIGKGAFYGWLSNTGEMFATIYIEGKNGPDDFDVLGDVFLLDSKKYSLPSTFDETSTFIYLGK